MGAALVGAALNPDWSRRLTATEHRILLAMAHTARDTANGKGQPPREYWGGHEYLMLVSLGDLPEPESVEYRNGRRLVERTIRRLIETGAIERTQAGRRGQRARYKITLNGNQPTLEGIEQ